MSVVKNRSTPENRAFWDHVELVARQVRDNPLLHNFTLPCKPGCKLCEEVIGDQPGPTESGER